MDTLLESEGKLRSILDKLGQMILLSVFWILGTVLILPCGGVTTALYYSMIKSIRRDRGDALQEFKQSFRANFARGLAAFGILAVVSILLAWNVWLMTQMEYSVLLKGGTLLLTVLVLFVWCYIFPVLSRFQLPVLKALPLALSMSLRFLPFTLLLMAGFGLVVALQIFVLPMATLLILPSAWCMATTYLVEKALRQYMPPKEDDSDAWYYE